MPLNLGTLYFKLLYESSTVKQCCEQAIAQIPTFYKFSVKFAIALSVIFLYKSINPLSVSLQSNKLTASSVFTHAKPTIFLKA